MGRSSTPDGGVGDRSGGGGNGAAGGVVRGGVTSPSPEQHDPSQRPAVPAQAWAALACGVASFIPAIAMVGVLAVVFGVAGYRRSGGGGGAGIALGGLLLGVLGAAAGLIRHGAL